MLLENSDFFLRFWLAFRSYSQFLQFPIIFLLASITTLLSWRLWQFSITPWLYPEEPREVPYWIPFIGHALRFVKNQDKTLTYGREFFKNTREPFAIKLGREKLYILTSYHDVAAVIKNNTTLDYGNIIKNLMRSFGVSGKGVDAVYAPDPEFSGDIRQQNPHKKSLFHLKSDFYHTQLHPGKQQFNVIQEKVLGLLSNAMTFESLTNGGLLSSKVDVKEASLYKLCQHVFVEAGLRAFFGEHIFQISPSLLNDFVEFDDNNWMVFYNWTGPNVQAMRKPKAKVLAVLEAWLRLPKAQRPGAAWLIETMEESQRQLGMKEADIAVVLMMLMWVVNTNAYRVSFWMLAYILHFPSLRATIEAEITPSLGQGGSVDSSNLTADCPHLDSLWFEILRLTNASSALRTILEPTQIGTKLLNPGNKVMTPFRQLHFDQDVFGEGANCFDPDRFFRNKDLSRHPSYKPFGGGVTMCPGRFVARQETFVFIAMLLHRFAPELTPGNHKFPRFELETPTTGIISPRSGDDVVVTVKEKRAPT